jgi:long-subunit acyl-CoA synthetase (AMP-forming)
VHDYATLASRVARQAAAMRASGLERGDRVALVSRNHPAYLEALFACWWAGSSPCRSTRSCIPKELAWVLDDAGARWAFVDDEWHAALGGMSLATLERAIVVGGRGSRRAREGRRARDRAGRRRRARVAVLHERDDRAGRRAWRSRTRTSSR